ncbi:tripartite tricarboxylate transporter substrate binding protein [Advenella sp. WQ 585]|uniref:Tripartite tricarboxylate transporter substrate binding protein n=1 Tax=Advenella mandrilli TaxID=2800330 RepID=A0ABS1E830_9BURK|nr:tripartite tricarboxylate transporter substrate binding protein [Advenella mandrilli]MBK1779717.1 tripartite tricarboxylate transporter substrate binding protein [Advenella mandrilli]
MKTHKTFRHLHALSACTLLALFTATTTHAATDYPKQPISLIVPYSPGGNTDALARLLADHAGKRLEGNIVIEYKAGANGTMGAMHMKNQKPDGYSLSLLPLSVLRQPYLVKVKYDPLQDLTWIASVSNYTYVIAVPAKSPWQSIEELVEDAKNNPGKYSYAASAQYSSNHLAMTELGREAGLDWTFIPYKGDSDAITALLGDHVNIISATSTILPFVENGQVRVLAVAGAERSPDFPDTPTLKERGFNVEMLSPLGIGGPAGMNPDVVAKLAKAVEETIQDPAFIEKARPLGIELSYRNHQDYTEWAKQTFTNEKEIINRLKDE